LSLATFNGHETIVKLLLANRDEVVKW